MKDVDRQMLIELIEHPNTGVGVDRDTGDLLLQRMETTIDGRQIRQTFKLIGQLHLVETEVVSNG